VPVDCRLELLRVPGFDIPMGIRLEGLSYRGSGDIGGLQVLQTLGLVDRAASWIQGWPVNAAVGETPKLGLVAPELAKFEASDLSEGVRDD